MRRDFSSLVKSSRPFLQDHFEVKEGNTSQSFVLKAAGASLFD